MHNLVNERLRKPEFDCGSVTEAYKCGCADEGAGDEGAGDEGAGVDVDEGAGAAAKEGITVGRELTPAEDVDLLEENTRGARVEVLKEG